MDKTNMDQMKRNSLTNEMIILRTHQGLAESARRPGGDQMKQGESQSSEAMSRKPNGGEGFLKATAAAPSKQIKSASSSSSSPFFDESSSTSSLFAANYYSSSANSTASNSPVNSPAASRFGEQNFNNYNKTNNQRPRSLIVVKKTTPPPPATARAVQEHLLAENVANLNLNDESIIAYSAAHSSLIKVIFFEF